MNALDFEHKTECKVEMLQKEIEQLKRRVQYLEHLVPNFGQAVAYVTHVNNVSDTYNREDCGKCFTSHCECKT